MIGRLERILILTFIGLSYFEGLGFLVAAKSIFRFGEFNAKDNRREAEYILIGTLLSFAVAIGIGMLAWGLAGGPMLHIESTTHSGATPGAG